MAHSMTPIVMFSVMVMSTETVRAEQGQPGPAPQQSVDVSKLPVNLDRLQKKLVASVEREQRDGLVLRYTVQVFEQAPRIKLITPEDNIRFGPTRSTAPTHKEMMRVVSPVWVR